MGSWDENDGGSSLGSVSIGSSDHTSDADTEERGGGLSGADGGGGIGPVESLESFCSQVISEACITPIEKVWLSIARIDGGSGQLLGQAAAGGLDGLRAWLCSLLVWKSRASLDFALPVGKSDLAKAEQDLSELCGPLTSSSSSS